MTTKKRAPLVKAALTRKGAKKVVPAPAKKAAPAPAKKVVPAKKAAPAPAKKVVPAKKAAPAPAKKVVPAKKAAPAPAKKAGSAPAKKAAPAPALEVIPAPKPAPAKKAAPSIAPAPKRPTVGPYAKEPKFLDEQRALLVEERIVCQGQAVDLRAEADSLAQEREPGDVQFDAEGGEGGTAAVDRERDLALSAQAVVAVEEIDDALERINRKTYGTCERCYQSIPKARLRALAYARLCVACKSGGLSRR